MNKDSFKASRHTISFRLLLIYLVVIVSVTVLCVLSINALYSISMQTVEGQALSMNTLISDLVSKHFVELDIQSRDYTASGELQDFLRSINSKNTNELPYYKLKTDWNTSVSQRFAFVDGSYKNVGVIDGQGRLHSYGYAIDSALSTELLNLTQHPTLGNGGVHLNVVDAKGNASLVLIRSVRDLKYMNLSTMGYLFYIIDFNQLFRDNVSSYLSFSKTHSVVVLNGHTLYSNADFDVEPALRAVAETNNSATYFHNNKRYLLSGLEVPRYNMICYAVQDVSGLIHSLRISRATLLILVPLVAAFIFLFAWHRTIHITKRITDLSTSVQQVYEQQFKLDISSLSDGYSDEVSVLASSFQTLVAQVDSLVNENLIRQLLHQEAQIRFLQSQINPHFLYNTLDTISALATLKRLEPISDISTSMASILRYSLDENILSYIGDEMDILRKYLIIQKLRYGNRIELVLKVNANCLNIEIPKMTLQPLIENAIKYSVEAREQNAQVRLHITKLNNNLVLTILDTGIGMPEDIAYKLSHKDFNLLPGHGLKNVFMRLNNLFESRLHVAVRSRTNQMTALKITIVNQGDFINVEKGSNPCS